MCEIPEAVNFEIIAQSPQVDSVSVVFIFI